MFERTKNRTTSGVSQSSEYSSVMTSEDSGELLSARSETSLASGISSLSTPRPQHFVVVAVDFGTTYSGYAFSFVHRPDQIHMMRRWSGGDPGISNQKTPTTILLKPSGAFHSFGFEARDFYHDLDPQEARNWFYFERFKMALHSNLKLSKTTQLVAANQKTMPAIQVFAHALRFFRQHALQELSDELGTRMRTSDVRWVVTVPAIWRPQAKQFMREAAYQAGLASEDNPSQLVIALEPEAASIYCRKLRNTQLQTTSPDDLTIQESLKSGCQYMVVDCGGGTVDVTVHMIVGSKTLQEVRAASGGAMGSVAVDAEFERLLRDIFGDDFIEEFRRKRPAGAVDLFVAWESRKRSASPSKNCSLNISLPFSFIDLHRKLKQASVDEVVKKYNDPNVKWSSQGMLRITPALMRRLFQPTLDAIVNHVASQIDSRISHLFLVGGFAESPLLQQQLRNAVGDRVRVIIPNDVSLTILKGAVLFGLDPTTVRMRTSQMTYGVGILNAFDASKHPAHKRLIRDGHVWCTDIFDAYVIAGSMVGLGDVVQRSYAPVRRDQNTVVINLYSCERSDVKFIDEEGVRKCATLRVHLPVTTSAGMTSSANRKSSKRELQISMMYGDTEIKVHCLDVVTGTKVNASIDFLAK
uniref:heat shock 70 kDa protein 12A-like n=1 Tax=Styela clava TaxID=7725 RepID=UPI00193A9A07|nr:heat shock 70 kDa protein 12A-like [Styela clava]